MKRKLYRPTLEQTVNFFCNTQKTTTKEEAFLKGYLMGLGHSKVRRTPNFKLIKENPEMFIPIELDVIDAQNSIVDVAIDDVQKLLRIQYMNEKRDIPEWLKK